MSDANKQLRLPAGAIPCTFDGVNHGCFGGTPAVCATRPDWYRGRIVYTWDSGTDYPGYGTPGEAEGMEFLRAHGTEPRTFIIGNQLTVRVRCDGSLWLHLWRAIAIDEDGSSLLCEFCPHCVRQEQVVVPLVAPIPEALTVGAHFDDALRGVAVGVND